MLYRAGVERSESTRRIVTRRILVRVEPGLDARTVLADEPAVRVVGPLSWMPEVIVVEAAEARQTLEIVKRLETHAGIRSVRPALSCRR